MRKPTVVGLLLLFSSLIAGASLGSVFYAWHSTLKHAEHMVEELSSEAHLAGLQAVRDGARALLRRFNTSASNLARVFGSRSLQQVPEQVSHPLFLAYTAHRPIVSQATFFREDGLFFSYYDEGNGTTRVMFSNNTAPSRSTSGASPCCYSQATDEDSGDPVGSAAASTVPCNTTSWLGDAFARGVGYASLAPGWGRDEEPLLLFTSPVRAASLDRGARLAAFSLGVPVRALVESVEGGGAHVGGLFLAAADGRVLQDGGPPGADILLNNGTVSIHVQNPKTNNHFSKEEEKESVLPCTAGRNSSEGTLLDVGGEPFKFYCTSLDTDGINLMPIMNGYEATKQIRIEEQQYGIHIPIIALTAHSMAEQEIDFVQAGMDIHLMKPLKPDILLDAIHKIKKN